MRAIVTTSRLVVRPWRPEAAGIDRVWAIMWPRNAPSANLALAVGMRDLGVRHDPWYGTDDEPNSRMFVHLAEPVHEPFVEPGRAKYQVDRPYADEDPTADS